MKWTIKIDDKAAKALKDFDAPIKQRIEQFIDKLTACDEPRLSGKTLQGNLK